MKLLKYISLLAFVAACSINNSSGDLPGNPFVTELNEPIDYANVTADHLEEYAAYTLKVVDEAIQEIKQNPDPTFDNIFISLDEINNNISIASSNCFMLYWVSPDSLSRVKGYEGYQLLDSLSTAMYSDKQLFDIILSFSKSEDYDKLKGHRKNLVDQVILDFTQSGVNLRENDLAEYKKLVKEISELSSSYSNNMNSSNEVLILDDEGAAGLSENFKATYKTEAGNYEIPVISATRRPVTNNAENEETRKAYYFKYYNRAADQNLAILDSMVKKRDELAEIMGYDTYADYNLVLKMANNPSNVWNFLNDLIERSKPKAEADANLLKQMKRKDTNKKLSSTLQPWDIGYYNNQILKTEYKVDHEKIREYLPMDKCIEGAFDIYQELLGLEFRKVDNPSVWHEEVEMWEVYEDGKLKGRFYLDLFPRPNKESWFYGVPLTPGRKTSDGYEVPVSMLLGNFTRPTETLPSLLSHSELNTLFHEFGHIIDGLSYNGEFMYQARSKSDFVEAMSQIFENWIWDYEMLSTFAEHYETGEVLPKELFDNMLRAKNVSSGLFTLMSLRSCVYDMNLYNLYNPEAPMNTDDIWRKIDKDFGVIPMFVNGTHPQASWIHINTHPVYYYGYLWAEVYSQDMFTLFENNGLTDRETGMRYRKLILANGTQRDIVEAVEEFLGRESNNEAYIKSLGLN